jgi:diaminopimelate decarboxylase
MQTVIPSISSHITPSLAAQLLVAPEKNMEGDLTAGKTTDAKYVYSRSILTAQVEALRNACSAAHIFPRYAMKANHNADIMRAITGHGIDIDASSTAEAEHAMALGVAVNRIQITSQQWDGERTIAAIQAGCRFVACSEYQLQEFCRAFPGGNVGVRINP